MRWYLRLGYPGPEVLKHFVNTSKEVRIRGLTTVECNAYGTSKMKKRNYRAFREVLKDPGERLAIDFYNYPDLGGYFNLILVTDRRFGLIWDCYL